MFRTLKALFISTLLVFLFAPGVMAGNGAVVKKGTYPEYWGLVYNPDQGLSYWFSNISDVCGCIESGDGGVVLEVPRMIVHRPKDSDDLEWNGKYQDRSFFFVRALMATPEEFWADPCGVWSNPDLIVADGMIYSASNDNDQFPADTNRAKVWSFSAYGAREDFGDHCKGEAARI